MQIPYIVIAFITASILLKIIFSLLNGQGEGGGILLVGCGSRSCAKLRGFVVMAGHEAYKDEAYTFKAVRDLILWKKPKLILSDLFLLNPTFGLELTRLCDFLGVQIVVVLVEARTTHPSMQQVCNEIYKNAQLFHGKQVDDIVAAIRDTMDPHRRQNKGESASKFP